MSQYARGAQFERVVRALLVGPDDAPTGWTIARSAGSKTKVDLWAVAPYQGLALIQCKLNGLCPPAERAALIDLARRARAVPVVAYKATEGQRRPIRFRLLTGVGPKEFRAWSPDEMEER